MSNGTRPSREERQDKPTIEEIESQIPEERKKMSFGGVGENIVDVMEQSEKDAHNRGRHVDEEHPTCPLCPDESNHVSREVSAKNNREKLREAKEKRDEAKDGECNV